MACPLAVMTVLKNKSDVRFGTVVLTFLSGSALYLDLSRT
jgi:hypothetical protein